MKKQLFLILLTIFSMSGIWSFGQDTAPSPIPTKLIAPNSPVWYYNTLDSSLWVFKGQTGWLRITTNAQLQKYYWSKTQITNADTARWGLNAGHDSLTIAPGSTPYFEVNYPQIFSGQKLIDSLGVINTKIAGKEPILTKGNLTSGSSKVTIGGNGTGAVIGAGASIDINEANIVHQNLSGSGTNTHAQIDTHITNDGDLSSTNELDNANHSGDATGATTLTLATVNSNIGTYNNITINAKGLATAGSNVAYLTSQTYPSSGIAVSTGSAWGTSITDNHTNWDKYNQWDGGATGLTAATGRASLGLGNSATLNLGTTAGTVLEGRTFGTAAANNTGDFILNQNSSPQAANMWINGSIRNNSDLLTNGDLWIKQVGESSFIYFGETLSANINWNGSSLATNKYFSSNLGFQILGTPLLLDWLKSGSAPASGNIVVGNGSTTNPSGVSVNQAIGGNTLTSGYLPYWDGSKLVNGVVTTDGSKIAMGAISLQERLNIAGNIKMESEATYIELRNSNWALSSYIQAGVNFNGTTLGDYFSIIIPSGKNISFTTAASPNALIEILSTGSIKIPSLSGTDNRLVSATSDGTLSTLSNASGYLYNDGTNMSFTSLPSAVTSISAGNGMNFTTITGTGSVTLGTPTTLTASTTNTVTTTSHTHQITGFLPLTGGTLTGAVTSNNSFTGTNFILSSDKRLKQGIRTLTNTDWVERIKFVRYEMKSNPEIERYGVIAQDVEEVNKYLVYTDENGIKSVSYIDLLIAKIANLEKRISELENKKKRHEK